MKKLYKDLRKMFKMEKQEIIKKLLELKKILEAMPQNKDFDTSIIFRNDDVGRFIIVSLTYSKFTNVRTTLKKIATFLKKIQGGAYDEI